MRAGLARRGGDDDPRVGDLLDPPGGRAEGERVAGPALVHHLLVELADPAPVGEEHAEEAAVGDRAAVADRDATGARRGPGPGRGAVPHDAGLEARELVGRVAAREEVEDGVERAVGEVGERGRAAHHREERVDVPLVERARGDDLLGQHVERVAQVAGSPPRARPPSGGRPPPPRAGRPGTWGRCDPGWARRRGARPGRPAGGRAPPIPATRPARRGRPRPCRCPAPTSWWRRGRAALPA